MMKQSKYIHVGRELQRMLKPQLPDVEVQIGDDLHYKGTNVVVTSGLFEGLLAEQRFHHVVRAIPGDFYEAHLRSNIVWFELTPNETGADLMKMPRSTDVAAEQEEIHSLVAAADFCSKFQQALARGSQRLSATHFELTRKTLAKCGLGGTDITRACLFMILHGAYCDAQVNTEILPRFTSQEPGPAGRFERAAHGAPGGTV